ncbi:toll/interleukin-1 receptor domain-containing protein [Geovibrio thiophilus]|uniref:Toll/interleukin-1 receptor domain-containing protein n=1 Tax=Geovibrio thiophilus TaxID=139438 RepID=A0A3R5UZ55_9BACT|nr:toll/interleukin-1 receptor domain-containing protein [Geovibrio thiophilus]QAR34018.1 toll/interleukin-1 receptor domain-containing protein [Geovibrio thiophilus]
MSELQTFKIKNKIEPIIATLYKYYKSKEMLEHAKVIKSQYRIDEAVDYDNWNGGVYGHDIYFKISDSLACELIEKDGIDKEILELINKQLNIHNEYVSNVYLETDENSFNPNWREDDGVTAARDLKGDIVQASEYDDLWEKPGLRLFLSHKANYKKETKILKDELAKFGIRAFVAHEDITPSAEWQTEIERALSSMDALVALLTPDFHESEWTDQEVGIAFGRRVPIISLRLGRDPYGFFGKWQGISCIGKTDSKKAEKIFSILFKKHCKRHELFNGIIFNFKNSSSFANSKANFQKLEEITPFSDEEKELIKEAYNSNSQNYGCTYAKNRLNTLMED